jgi:hypothetical protein
VSQSKSARPWGCAEEPGDLLAAEGAQQERHPERPCRQGVADVVDQVGEEGDRAGENEDPRLYECGQSEDAEAQRDGLDAGARAENRPVDEALVCPC